MFLSISQEQARMACSLPERLAPYEGEYRGIRFSIHRKVYGQTLARMTGTSLKTGISYVFSIGVVRNPRLNRPELRVDFVKRWERRGSSGQWVSGFDPRNKTHRDALRWAAEAFLLALQAWHPAPAGNEEHRVEAQHAAPVPKVRVVKPRKGCTYTTKRGTVVTRRDHMAAVYQNAPATKTEFVPLN